MYVNRIDEKSKKQKVPNNPPSKHDPRIHGTPYRPYLCALSPIFPIRQSIQLGMSLASDCLNTQGFPLSIDGY